MALSRPAAGNRAGATAFYSEMGPALLDYAPPSPRVLPWWKPTLAAKVALILIVAFYGFLFLTGLGVQLKQLRSPPPTAPPTTAPARPG